MKYSRRNAMERVMQARIGGLLPSKLTEEYLDQLQKEIETWLEVVKEIKHKYDHNSGEIIPHEVQIDFITQI